MDTGQLRAVLSQSLGSSFAGVYPQRFNSPSNKTVRESDRREYRSSRSTRNALGVPLFEYSHH